MNTKEPAMKDEGKMEHGGEIKEIWQELLDKDDRTSPAEYPEMVLISFDELAQIIEDQHMRARATLEAEWDANHAAMVDAINEGRS